MDLASHRGNWIPTDQRFVDCQKDGDLPPKMCVPLGSTTVGLLVAAGYVVDGPANVNRRTENA